MIGSHARLPLEAPELHAPPPLRERRSASRRAEDQAAAQEASLLARALDILADGSTAEARLSDLLDLLARTVGARHAAIVSEGTTRRVAVGIAPDEDPADALALGAWLDGAAPRSAAERAAAVAAPIAVAIGSHPASTRRPLVDPSYAQVAVPTSGRVTLGFSFGDPDKAAEAGVRLPRTLARHAAVALALVTDQLESERELAVLRAQEAERATFVSTVAHELRTPLTGLAGYLDLILAGSVDDPAVEREFMERGRGIVTTIADLVGDLLELSRLESGTMAIDRRSFSLSDALTHVADGLDPIAMERGHRRPDHPAAPLAGGDRRPAPGRADRHQPRRQRPQVRPGRIVARPRRVVRRVGRPGRRPRRGQRHQRRRPRSDLRAVLPDGRPRPDHRHGPRPADRPRPGPSDGRRPRRRERAGGRLHVPAGPARADVGRARMSSRRPLPGSSSPRSWPSRNAPSCTPCAAAPDVVVVDDAVTRRPTYPPIHVGPASSWITR